MKKELLLNLLEERERYIKVQDYLPKSDIKNSICNIIEQNNVKIVQIISKILF